MRGSSVVFGMGVLVLGSGIVLGAQADKVTARAHADIKGEGVTGSAELTETTSDTGGIAVEVEVTAKGLKPGLHAVHLHAVGKCEAPFTSAGGHFDPGPASNTDPDANHPFHMGDIPNIQIGADGSGTLKWRTTRVGLTSGPLALLDDDGAAIIIHANPDQYITGASKSGVSGGPRAACGVIEKK
jgi:Cu-Zn family superoxide dismutase